MTKLLALLRRLRDEPLDEQEATPILAAAIAKAEAAEEALGDATAFLVELAGRLCERWDDEDQARLEAIEAAL